MANNRKPRGRKDDRPKFEDLPFDESKGKFERAFGKLASDTAYAMRMTVVLKYRPPDPSRDIARKPLSRLEMFEKAQDLLRELIKFWEGYKKSEVPVLLGEARSEAEAIAQAMVNAKPEPKPEPARQEPSDAQVVDVETFDPERTVVNPDYAVDDDESDNYEEDEETTVMSPTASEAADELEALRRELME